MTEGATSPKLRAQNSESFMSLLRPDNASSSSSAKSLSVSSRGTAKLEWTNVSFTVPDPMKPGKKKHILREMSGSARGGRMLAIMGCSGAGKTSLLNILSGRTQAKCKKYTKGQLLLNGNRMRAEALQENIAFVQQEDVFMPTDTPREALEFSANLRLPKKTSKAVKRANVKRILQLLGLQKSADTKIGDIRLKGISGGEKRRVSIGIEMISDPSIVFLDEPTSGLDSVTATSVCEAMRSLALSGKIVIATIHQPSSKIFHLFDDLLLLSGGKVAYHGPLEKTSRHFEDCGYPCPQHYNPADFYLDILDDPEKSEEVAQSHNQRSISNSIDIVTGKDEFGPEVKRHPTPGFCTQLMYLIRRECMSIIRDPKTHLTTLCIEVAIAFFLGCMNWKCGKPTAYPLDVINALMLPIITCFFMGATRNLLVGVVRRTLFDREHMAGTYTIVPYILAMVIVGIPISVINSAAVVLVLQMMIQFQANLVLLWLALFIAVNLGVSLGLTMGLSTGNMVVAGNLMPLILIPQICLAGFLRPPADCLVWLRWPQWISGLKYTYCAALILEFGEDRRHFIPYGETDKVQAKLGAEGTTNRIAALADAHNTLAEWKDRNFTRNTINSVNPQEDLLFYMLFPLVLYAVFIMASMVSLKWAAMKR